MIPDTAFDAIVLVGGFHATWQVESRRAPLFVCREMFVDLKDIEARRWRMWELRRALANAGHPVAILSDFLVSEDIAWLETEGAAIAHKWYCDETGQDLTEYRGISLGRCIEYDIKARAIRLLKLVRCIERLHARYPSAMFFVDSSLDSIEWRVIEGLGIPVQWFGGLIPVSDVMTPPVKLPWSARLLQVARHAGLWIIRLLSRVTSWRAAPTAPRIVVRIGLQSSMMLRSWLEKPREGVYFCLWMNYLIRPWIALRLVLAGHSVTEPSRAPLESLALVHVFAARDKLFNLPLRRTGAHLAVQPLFDDMLRDVSQYTFPVVAAAIEDAFAELGRANTALLVIPNDCQPLTRAWTLVSAALGHPSLVLQHGHLDYTEDEDHLTASHSAFWSDMVAADYRAQGLRPEQVSVTGSPNADALVRARTERRLGVVRQTRHPPRILIITTGNPGVQAYVRETWVCDYIAEILKALQPSNGSWSVSIKLHPGEDAALYRKHLADLLPSESDISDRGDLVQMVMDADIVVSPPSTVVLEARAGGVPVIVVPISSPDDRRTTLVEVEGVLTVRNARDLPPAIDEVLAQLPHRAGTWSLERFLGPLDGRSSRRALDAVCGLALSRGTPAHVVRHELPEDSNAVR